MKLDEKKTLKDVFKKTNQEFGIGSISFADENDNLVVESIPTGCLSLDDVFGIGGLPRGRIMDIFGMQSAGKTALCLHLIAQVQKQGFRAAFIDAEFSFSSGYAKKLGVDTDKLIFMQPTTAEQAFTVIEELVHTGEVALIVVDSTAALVPEKELDGEISDAHVALQARMLSKALRMITGAAARTKTTVIFISQVRDKISTGFQLGPPTDSTGGKALKFFASVRLEVSKLKSITGSAKAVIGNHLKIKGVKNKMAPPFKEAEIDLYFERGIDLASDTLLHAERTEVVEHAGNSFSFAGEKFALGRENAVEVLSANPELYEKVCKAIEKKNNEGKATGEKPDEKK